MTDLDFVSRTSTVRRVLAAIVLLVGGCSVAVGIYALSNPGRYVLLFEYLRSPFASVLLIFVTLLLSWVLAFPVRRPVEQRRRSQVRSALVVLVIVSFLAFIFVYVGKFYRYDPVVIATSASGQREAAVVQLFNTSELRIFVGSGLARRDMGSFGSPCGTPDSITATFVSDTEIKISTAYNDYDFHLTPEGTPIGRFGPTCSS